MLIQSHTGIVHLFPAIPKSWNRLSFKNLRTEGAFLISTEKENGIAKKVMVYSEKGGEMSLKNPFNNDSFNCSKGYSIDNNGNILLNTKANEEIALIGTSN